MRLARAAGLSGLLLGLLLAGTGCSGDPGPAGAASAGRRGSPSAAPALGGPPAGISAPPTTLMDRLERPVAARLARQARAQGLTLDYLDCPGWDHTMPSRLVCTGWFDGVPTEVRVRLRYVAGGSVTFDATIGDGVIATRNLVGRLRDRGYADANCGDRAAYPARVGLQVVCAVGSGAARRYLVATVTSRSGGVVITGY